MAHLTGNRGRVDERVLHRRGHDLADFRLRDMVECGRALRNAAGNSATMEGAAQKVVQYLYSNLISSNDGEPNCALIRCFKTHRFDQLPPDLAELARAPMVQREPGPDLPCLTLLATAGESPEWNDRKTSKGHAAIPLESVEMVERAPMIASLIRQMGLGIEAALYPDPQLILDADQHAFNVFHVEDALGDPSIPAQQGFVKAYGIRSVLGFGGLLPSGDLFAVILFAKVRIRRDTAALFRTIALGVKLALLPHTRGQIFEDKELDSPEVQRKRRFEEQDDVALKAIRDEQLRSETGTLQLLLTALEDAALEQTAKLQLAYDDLKVQGETVLTQGVRLGAMLTGTTDAVLQLDDQWRFTFLNGHAQQLIGGEKDLVGCNLWTTFPEMVGTSFEHQYRRAMSEESDVKFEEYYPKPIDKWFEVHAFPSEGGLAVFFHDVTDRKKSEAALRQTEKLAATGKLAASIAHEINNPLESITNLLYLVSEDSSLSTETRSFVSLAEGELQRVAEITTHMLRFHRVSTNATALNVNEILDSVLVLYKGRLAQAAIEVKKRYETTATMTGHAGELRQIFANLVGNAIDASRLGGLLQLRTRYARDPENGVSGVIVVVADTGSGMSQAVVERIFEPFFTTKGITGTGLGLWVTAELVQKHGGKLRVRSSDRPSAHGTVFSLFFPVEYSRQNHAT